jgi:hypothetical protein
MAQPYDSSSFFNSGATRTAYRLLASGRKFSQPLIGSGMSGARLAAMVGINYSTFCSWVQERSQKQGHVRSC